MESIWLSSEGNKSEPLNGDFECDVVIVGGGIAGMSSAYHLQKAGLNVAVFEKDSLSAGSTGRGGGFLASSTTHDFSNLVDRWGEEKGKRIYRSISESIESIKGAVESENIDCDFRQCGAFYFAAEKSDVSALEEEYELLKKHGYEVTLYRKDDPTIPVANNFGAIKTYSDCAFDPVRFIHGLAGAIKSRRGSVFTGTRISSMEEKGDRIILKDTHGHTVKCKYLVMATNGFSLSKRADPATIQYGSHIMVTKPVEGIEKRWRGELIWDTYEIYHYLRLLDDNRILIGGEDSLFGRNKPREVEKKNYHLLKKLREHFPGLKIEIAFGWTGWLSYPLDGIPTIKRTGNIIHLITDGVPFGWLLGQMATDRIIKNSSPLDDLYDYDRDYGFFENIIIKSRLPNVLKYIALKSGLAFVYIFHSLDEKFRN